MAKKAEDAKVFSMINETTARTDLSPSHKIVLIRLRTACGTKGTCKYKIKTLAQCCSLSERRTREIVADLCEMGILERHHNSGRSNTWMLFDQMTLSAEDQIQRATYKMELQNEENVALVDGVYDPEGCEISQGGDARFRRTILKDVYSKDILTLGDSTVEERDGLNHELDVNSDPDEVEANPPRQCSRAEMADFLTEAFGKRDRQCWNAISQKFTAAAIMVAYDELLYRQELEGIRRPEAYFIQILKNQNPDVPFGIAADGTYRWMN